MSAATEGPADPADLARKIAELATQLREGEVPDGQRWLRTFELHRLAGRLLRDTPDDRADDQITPPQTRYGEP